MTKDHEVKISFGKDLELSPEQFEAANSSYKILRSLNKYEGKPVTVNSVCVLQGEEGIEYLLEGKGLGEFNLSKFKCQDLGVCLTQAKVDKMYKK